jgi:3-hydroxyisobutyrate dehydrogenase
LVADVTTRVAVVGTGRMGSAMVGRLVVAGHHVTVYNRTPSKAQRVAAAHGLLVAATPREAA